jgi:hypothetical protein
VKGSEFHRRLKALARQQRRVYHWRSERGAGSHGTVYFRDRFTIVKDLNKELGPGLLSDMCRQLGIQKANGSA